jgi:hypothetical protein
MVCMHLCATSSAPESGQYTGSSAGMFAASNDFATPLVSCFASLVEGLCSRTVQVFALWLTLADGWRVGCCGSALATCTTWCSVLRSRNG